MIRQMHRVRFALGIVCVLSCVGLHACWATSPGIEPPDIREPVGELEQLSTRLESIYAVLERDVTRMGTLRVAFFSPPSALYAPPFPIDLFRHVALTCLNELPTEDLSSAEATSAPDSTEVESEQPLEEEVEGTDADANVDGVEEDGPREPEAEVADEGLGLSCQPANLPFLLSQIPPQRLDFATTQLRRVDEVRTLRLRIERRIARLPRILAIASNRIAEQRAARRQLADQINKRKLDYNKDQWDEANKRLARYKREIERGEKALEALQKQLELEKSWLERSREEMNFFLYDLVWLGLDNHVPAER